MEPNSETPGIPLWLSALFSFLGLLVGIVGKWILDFLKNKKDIQISGNKATSDLQINEVGQAIAIYRELVVTLRADMKQLAEYNNKLEKEYTLNREEIVRLKLTLDMIGGTAKKQE